MKKRRCPINREEARRLAEKLSRGKPCPEILYRQIYLHLTEGNLSVDAELRAALLNWRLAVEAKKRLKKGGDAV